MKIKCLKCNTINSKIIDNNIDKEELMYCGCDQKHLLIIKCSNCNRRLWTKEVKEGSDGTEPFEYLLPDALIIEN